MIIKPVIEYLLTFQILADFDFTLTHLFCGSEKMSSSFGALEKYQELSEEFRKKAKALYDYYYPKEVDPSIPHEDKTKLMTEWYVGI